MVLPSLSIKKLKVEPIFVYDSCEYIKCVIITDAKLSVKLLNVMWQYDYHYYKFHKDTATNVFGRI